MEFNIPIMLDGATDINITQRSFDEKKPYYPCDSIKEDFLESCYFELPQYWKQVFQGDTAKVGELCDGVKDKNYRETCFLGLGHVIAPSSGYDVKKSVSQCKSMPSHEEEILCRGGLTWAFFAEKSQNKFRDVCADLSAKEAKLCLEKGDLMKTNGRTFESF
jgi:hypothetical protein